jgi:hypothetical protein
MSQPPAWLNGLANAVAKALEPLNSRPLAPLACHYTNFEKVWEISLFTEATEVVGGPEDGCIKQSPFGVRINEVLDLFQSVHSCNWLAHSSGANDDLGPHLSIDGSYKGRRVWLRILAQAPRRFPTRRVSVKNDLINDDVW